MQKPEITGLSAAACIAVPATAVSVLGSIGYTIAAVGAGCNIVAVVPIIGSISIIS